MISERESAASRERAGRSSEAPPRGTRIAGRYVLLDELGHGGMARVFRARDRSTDRVIALKLLDMNTPRPTQAAALFEREYHTLVGLRHPRIVDVYEYGLSARGPFYTMELLGGVDLRELAPLPYARACAHLRDVASALALLHSRKLLHRDVSPRNVRLTSDGHAKLLDFGALATFGATGEVVGTPPCIAPEVLLGASLDQRTDLFALGALLYWTLTRKHAFPALRLDLLPSAWRDTPPAPSVLRPEVPPELDALTMSLLSLDALARPSSAAAVIDRLNAIAGLEPEREVQTAESYLSSSAMVGRSADLAQLEAKLSEAQLGNGSCVLIESEPGLGKTRLLHELALKAQLLGATVIATNAELGRGSWGLAKQVVLGALQALPADAREAAQPHAAVLAHLSDDIRRRLRIQRLASLPEDAGERRLSLQVALHGWLVELIARRPLVVAIDNLQRADEASLALVAVLASGAHKSKLLLVGTVRTGEHPDAEGALSAVQAVAARLPLRELSADEFDTLIKSLFGDVANAGRLAKRLHERSGGNLLACMELVQVLVRGGVLRYADGSWVLPQDVSGIDLPAGLDAVLAARVTSLSPGALKLAEGLSILSGDAPLERLLWLADELAEKEAFSLLDELVSERILVGVGNGFRFSHDALKNVFLRRLDPPRRRALHKKLAERLAANASAEPLAQLEVGWHLLSAGEEAQGAELLMHAGISLPREHAGQAVPALKAALGIFEKQVRPEHELAMVLLPLVSLAYYVDWRVVVQHGERALLLGLRVTGLELAVRLRRCLGRRPALIVALLVAAFRLGRRRFAGARVSVVDLVVATCTAVPSTFGVAITCLDNALCERILRLIEPLTFFGRTHVAPRIHELCVALLAGNRGRQGESAAATERLLQVFQGPAKIRGLTPDARRAFAGGLLLYRGVQDAFRLGPQALRTAEELEQVGLRVFAGAAEQIRLLYHAFRGEMDAAERCREKLELHAVQGGSTWQYEIFLPAAMIVPYTLTRDAVNLRRVHDQLEARAREIPSLAFYAKLAQEGYVVARGDFKASAAQHARLLPEVQPRERIGWQQFWADYALALNGIGASRQAKQVCLEILLHSTAEDRQFAAFTREVDRQLALAEAGLGNHAEAKRLLDVALAEHAAADNPLILGLLYKARAEVALLADDTEQFGRDVEKMESHFRRTNNPNLIGQWEHLVSHAGSAAQRNVAIESLAALIAISPDSAQATVRDLSPGMSLEGEATVREPVSAKR